MAAKSRRSYASLIEALRGAPERFDFLQAVRLLERASTPREAGDAAPGLIGYANDPRRETLRLRTALDLAFPATEVVAFDDTGARPELTVTLLGLVGVSGVMPVHYSRLLLEAERDNNPAPRAFLDMFHHRALSLFVRAAEKYRLPLAYERAGSRGRDTISGALRALIGMRGQALQDRQAIGDETLVFYAGHFSHGVRTADALRQILSEHFGRPVGVIQFQGRWSNLSLDEQTRLGAAGPRTDTDGRLGYAALGSSAILGTRVWDVQGSFRLTMGPLDYAEYQRLMPGEVDMSQLAALTRSYVGAVLSFDVQLTLKATEIPELRISSRETAGARLGWNTWLPTTGPRSDARDPIFEVETG